MKLNKKICRRCWREYKGSFWRTLGKIPFDARKTCCPSEAVLINSSPAYRLGWEWAVRERADVVPDHCPFKVEHERAEQKQVKLKLSKEVCRKCYDARSDVSWAIFDDERWQEGFVMCCACNKRGDWIIVRLDVLPGGCPYRMEHIVVGDKQ